jgi:hypothetical protein
MDWSIGSELYSTKDETIRERNNVVIQLNLIIFEFAPKCDFN